MAKTCMIVDSSVLQDMIEDNNTQKAIEVLKLLKEIEDKQKDKQESPLWIVTPSSSLLRAIYLADPSKFKLQNLQKVINCITVAPSLADFRDKEAVTKEIIIFAKSFSKQ